MDEQISMLMDGELDAVAARSCLDRMRKNRNLGEEWALFHLIGDQLRAGSGATVAIDCSRRVAGRLAAEPATFVPRPAAVPARIWRPLSAAASILGVAIVVWAALSLEPRPQPEFSASAPRLPLLAQAENVPMPDASRDYLVAHQGVSPSGVLQGVGAYVRTVSERGAEGGMPSR